VGDDEGRGHDLKTEDTGEGGGAEGIGNEGGVVSGIFEQCAVDAVEDGGEIGSGAAAGIEDADGGASETEGLVEVGAQKLVNALDHVFDDLPGGVPDTEVFAELGIECFEKRLVEVGNCFVFAEGVEECGLDAVERFSGEVENLLELCGVESAGVGDLAEKLAEDRDAEIVGGEAPVKARAGLAAVVGATPEDPCGEDAVKECLDEGRAKEVLALLALEPHAEGFLKGGFDGVEAAQGMIFNPRSGFAGVGGEEPGYVFGLDERSAVEQGAGEEVGKQIFVAVEAVDRGLPEVGSGCGESVVFQCSDGPGGIE